MYTITSISCANLDNILSVLDNILSVFDLIISSLSVFDLEFAFVFCFFNIPNQRCEDYSSLACMKIITSIALIESNHVIMYMLEKATIISRIPIVCSCIGCPGQCV